jgi:DNA invertase Pin-like site-specific DNA recombinase
MTTHAQARTDPANPPRCTGIPRAVAYLRRSTDRQEQSLDDQRQAIETYAKQEGFDIVQWFVDDAISGTSTQARKGFQAMVQAAQDPASTFRHVLVYDVKRFGRVDTDEAGYYRHLLRRENVEVIYVSEGFNGDDSDDLIRSVKQWQARNESKDLSKVTIRGQISHTENGFWCGGTPPFGYDLQYANAGGKPYQIVRWLANGDKEVYHPKGRLVRHLQRGERLTSSKKDQVRLVPSTPERIALVRRIFRESVDEGKGFRTITNHLNLEGILSPRDGNWSKNTRSRWSVGTIRAILRNPTYTGDTVWNRRTFAKFHRIQAGVAVPRDRQDADKPRENGDADWIIVPDTHEPIVSRATFDRAQELNLRPRPGTDEAARPKLWVQELSAW